MKMVLPLLIGAGRIAGMAAKGISIGVRAAGNAIKTGAQSAYDHPATQKIVEPINDNIIQHPKVQGMINHPASKAIGSGIKKTGSLGLAGAGLAGGLLGGSARLGGQLLGKTQGLGIIGFPIVLWLFDFMTGINGISWDIIFDGSFDVILKTLQGTLFLMFLVFYFIWKRPNLTRPQELIVPIGFFFIFALVWTMGRANFWIFVHLMFAFFTFIFILKGFSKDVEIGGAHAVFLLIMVWDLFAIPSLEFFIPDNSEVFILELFDIITNKLLFPIWIFYFFTFVEEGEQKNGALTFIWLFYVLYLGYEGINIYGDVLERVSPVQKEAVFGAPERVITTLTDMIKLWVTGQIQYAITGKVEENQYEPLGVYLENVESTAETYYIDIDQNKKSFEEVIVFGTVRGRTLDDPINIEVGCYVGKGGRNIPAEIIDPKNKFTIFSLEEQDFACTFTENQLINNVLKKGTNTITTFADFNFETLAFQKVYFIDRERLRAMTREGLDVFREFGIKDRNPVAVYTNGPAAIEMGTTSSLVGVSNNYLAFPRFSLSIKNRQGWEGRITKLKELVLLMPKGVNIGKRTVKLEGVDVEINDCNVIFEDYDLSDCKSSCDNFVYSECNAVCDSYGKGPSSEKDSCQRYCRDGQQDCEDQCQFLFNDDNQEYRGYNLSSKSIKLFNKRVRDDRNSERFERFSCKLNPVRDEVLGTAPITTKFFRVKARYEYIVEKSISVQIVELPGFDNIESVPAGSGEFRGSSGSGGFGDSSTSDLAVAIIYEKDNYKGDYIELGVGDERQLGKLEDEVSSIDIKPGYVISYYHKPDYGGNECRADVDDVLKFEDIELEVIILSLSSDKTFNDKISSLKVSKFEGAVLYEDENFKGRSDYYGYGSDANNFDNKCVDDDRKFLAAVGATNRVTSIKVAPGFKAILYDKKDYKLSDDSNCVYENIKCICADKDVRCIPKTIIPDRVTEIENLDVEGFNDDPSSIRIVKDDEYIQTASIPKIESPAPAKPIPITLVNPGFESEPLGKDVDWGGLDDAVRDINKNNAGFYSYKVNLPVSSKCYALAAGNYKLSAFTLLEEERARAALNIFKYKDTECRNQDFTTINEPSVAINIGNENVINEWHEITGSFSLDKGGSVIIELKPNFGLGWYDDVKLEKFESSTTAPTASPVAIN